MAMMLVEDLTVRRGGFELAVDRLELVEGEVVALVGPNGAGKSTLLEILGLLAAPSSGRLLLQGEEVTRTLEQRRKVVYVPEDPYLFSESVLWNVGYGSRLRGDRAWRDRAAKLLERFGMAHLADRPARRLSSGEARKVALLRAVAPEPTVLLLDEPTANLDPASRRRVGRMVRDLAPGRAVMFSTHDLDEAHGLADRVVTLVDGRVSEAVHFNVYDGRVEVGDRGPVFRTEAGGPEMVLPAGPGLTPGAARAMVDPRAIVVSREPVRSSARNQWAGTVIGISAVRDEILLTADLGCPMVAVITRGSYKGMGIEVGDQVYLSVKATSVKVSRRI